LISYGTASRANLGDQAVAFRLVKVPNVLTDANYNPKVDLSPAIFGISIDFCP